MKSKDRRRTMAAFALITTLGFIGAAVVYAAFTAQVTSSVNVTSTAGPVLAITAAGASNGGSCAVTSPTTAGCSGSSIGQGGFYTITVTVTNTGSATATVTASANTPSLSGASFSVSGNTPATQTASANGGTATWIFIYTAGQTTGGDTAVISITS